MPTELLSDLCGLAFKKLQGVAQYYSEICPALSRIVVQQMDDMKQSLYLPASPNFVSCQYCGSMLRPGNHRVVFLPMLRPNAKVRQLNRRKARGEALGVFQRRLLEQYQNSCNVLVIHCLVCTKKTRIQCPGRPEKKVDKPKPFVQAAVKEVKKFSRSAKKKQRRKLKSREGDNKNLNVSAVSSIAATSIVAARFTQHMASPSIFCPSGNNVLSAVLTSTPVNTSTPITSRGKRCTPPATTININPNLLTPNPVSLLSSSTAPPEQSPQPISTSKKKARVRRSKSLQMTLKQILDKERLEDSNQSLNLQKFLTTI